MNEIYPWFALKSVKGIGNYLFKKLLQRFGTPENVLKAPMDELIEIDGISRKLAGSILSHKIPEKVKRDIELAIKSDIKIVTLNDEAYPPLLAQIHDPPPFLYVYGNLDPQEKKIAFVGSRSATAYGIDLTKRLCRKMAKIDFTIVSGMARGIDTCAHQGALEGKGRTIAVLGSGLNRIYPRENEKLFHKIAESGAVISELPLAAEPEAHNFPARNRIISGLCLGTVVIEAGIKSGSLITARLALEQNREVFAVPGNISSFKSAGSHKLIKQGAKLVENLQDILDELPLGSYDLEDKDEKQEKFEKNNKNGPKAKIEKKLNLAEDEELVVEVLGRKSVHIDEITQKTGLDSGRLLGIMLGLELKGIVKKTYGNFFKISD